jgi:hypothetical protein
MSSRLLLLSGCRGLWVVLLGEQAAGGLPEPGAAGVVGRWWQAGQLAGGLRQAQRWQVAWAG